MNVVPRAHAFATAKTESHRLVLKFALKFLRKEIRVGVCGHGTLFVQVHLFVNMQVKLLTKLRHGRIGEMANMMSMFFI